MVLLLVYVLGVKRRQKKEQLFDFSEMSAPSVCCGKMLFVG